MVYFEKWANTFKILEISWYFWKIEKIGKFMVGKLTKVFEILENSFVLSENQQFFWRIHVFFG